MKKNNDDNQLKKKINAPTMAYKTVYGKFPKEFLKGKTNFPKKIWNGIEVDYNLKDKWLEELNSIGVEIRSTEEGKDKIRVAFVIFRMPENYDNLVIKMVKNLKNEKDVYVSYDIGYGNRPRICIAKNINYNQPEWSNWWNNLPSKIKNAYNKTLNQN